MNNIEGDPLCEICGCYATRYYGRNALFPLCDNRVCEQAFEDEMKLELSLNENNNEGDE